MEAKEFVQHLMKEGFKRQASDLYIFPIADYYELSFRYHHQKVVYSRLTEAQGMKMILFLKYLAEMNVSEKRKVQVGATSFLIEGKKKRIRLSTVADFRHRESMVIRFLYDFDDQVTLNYLFPQQLARIEKNIGNKGLFLFCGPTGSGKTTTMYKLAKKRNQKQVITIEDPVELEESSFLQLQTNEKIAITYEELIKVCLRNRPDILIVGEIRDRETAQMVVRGALTGHVIFSTLHTMNKNSALARLVELGVDPEEVKQCLKGVIYQRLLPTICSICGPVCLPYCQHQSENNGVLFDVTFYGKEEISHERKKWNLWLEAAWAYGFISKQTFKEELHEAQKATHD